MGRPAGSRNSARGKVARGAYLAVFEPDHPTANSDGYALEHRLVAWNAGILTDLRHHVHHVNGDKRDNRPENLAAMTEAAHHRHHVGDTVVNQYGQWALRVGSCSAQDCDLPIRAIGLCNRHYLRQRRARH